MALDESNQEFSDSYTIQVKVSGPTRPNVTLVDLPGFHTTNDDDTKRVNDMGLRYIKMPGTLVLHVVKGDQDYGSMLSNDFMRHASSGQDGNRVTVFTHCDKVDGKNLADAERLRNAVDNTHCISSQVFAVHGRAQNQEEEMEALKHVAEVDARIDIGAHMMATHLEERMRLHLDLQLPKAVNKLKGALDKTESRLEVIKEKEPLQAVLEMTRQVDKNMRSERQLIRNKLRAILEHVAKGINSFKIRPVNPPVDVQTVVHYVGDVWAALIEDIKLFITERGLRNTVHSDRQPIIIAYAYDFAEHAIKGIEQASQDIQKLVGDFFDKVFITKIPDISQSAAAALRALVRKEELRGAEEMRLSIGSCRSYNTDADLIFSRNEHYLSENIKRMVEEDELMAHDEGGVRHILHNVRAYIKVQMKFVSELAAKELVRILVIRNEKRCLDILHTKSTQLVEMVNEPVKIGRERKNLRWRKEVLEDALKHVPLSVMMASC